MVQAKKHFYRRVAAKKEMAGKKLMHESQIRKSQICNSLICTDGTGAGRKETEICTDGTGSGREKPEICSGSPEPGDASGVPGKRIPPCMDDWLKEAKEAEDAPRTGMYLIHNGVVREDSRASVRDGAADTPPVTGMVFSSDAAKVQMATEETLQMPGIFFVRVWLNEGTLQTGDDIMYVMIGGDIRPHVFNAMDFLVGKIKKECVTERELY